jgi:hypothetical protein
MCVPGVFAAFNSESFVFLLPSRNVKVKITIILLVVSYGCETWSLTLIEEGKMRVLENRVLSRKCGPCKRDDITGKWNTLHNEGLRDLFSSPDIIREIKSRKMM